MFYVGVEIPDLCFDGGVGPSGRAEVYPSHTQNNTKCRRQELVNAAQATPANHKCIFAVNKD